MHARRVDDTEPANQASTLGSPSSQYFGYAAVLIGRERLSHAGQGNCRHCLSSSATGRRTSKSDRRLRRSRHGTRYGALQRRASPRVPASGHQSSEMFPHWLRGMFKALRASPIPTEKRLLLTGNAPFRRRRAQSDFGSKTGKCSDRRACRELQPVHATQGLPGCTARWPARKRTGRNLVFRDPQISPGKRVLRAARQGGAGRPTLARCPVRPGHPSALKAYRGGARDPAGRALGLGPANVCRAALKLRNVRLGICGHDRGELKWVALAGGSRVHERPAAHCGDQRGTSGSRETAQSEGTSIHEISSSR